MMLCVFTLSILSINAWALRQLAINSGVNIAYDAPGVLSVSQPINQSDPAWDKEGYNATLNASAVKIESNSLSELAGMLTDNDSDGNPDGVTYTEDDYYTAPVYRKIDNVNVDINTGEIIGRLSDPDYPFEWYGREVTLPSGYTLASGRVLTEEETFTVDVYTYYPEMYIARFIAPDDTGVQRQYIHIAETLEDFEDITLPMGITPVYVKEWYTATFEATIFNPDHSVAKNSYGVICRSYIYDSTPTTNGSASYLITNYNYNDGTTDSQATVSTNQTNMMLWASNLTRAWESSGLSSEYRTATGVQGENYTAYIYNLLYLVKYANNNSQETVGYGNTYSDSPYSSATTSDFTKADGTALTSKDNYYLSQKGGGTIGVYNSGSKNTATYVQNNESGGEYEGDYILSSTGYDGAGMNYGYTYRDYVDNGKHGLYSPQFLTYTTSDGRRVLRDGYVGSDRYTSVFCLGMANPWGNVRTWIFGTGHISIDGEIREFINYNDYDYETGNWLLTSSSSYASREYLTGLGYEELGFALKSGSGYGQTYMSVDSTSSNTMMSLIGLSDSSVSFTGSTSQGSCDFYYIWASTSSIYGFNRGGCTGSADGAGVFDLSCDTLYNAAHSRYGFRLSLILL